MKVTVKGVDECVRHIQQVRKRLDNFKEVLQRLADIGFETAGIHFSTAQYDGTNDVETSIEWVTDKKVKVVAQGEAVTFIEFGTGISYNEQHPKAQDFGFVRGGYGKHQGLNNAWLYPAEKGTGTNGIESGNWILTEGNPPARAMDRAGNEIRSRIVEVIKEVYFG